MRHRTQGWLAAPLLMLMMMAIVVASARSATVTILGVLAGGVVVARMLVSWRRERADADRPPIS